MDIKNVKLDTDNMTFEEVNALVQQLRDVRARKEQLRSRITNFHAMVKNMRDEAMVFVNRYTGEILNPNDWELYDETTRSVYPEKEGE